MFSGLISTVGVIDRLEARDGSLSIGVRCNLAKDHVLLGASVSCSGICLTVTSAHQSGDSVHWTAELSRETLRCTTARSWVLGQKLNLEPSLRMGDPLGGHFVFGHVDEVLYCCNVREYPSGRELVFESREQQPILVAKKGSVAIDGVSLTVCWVREKRFSVFIIPHTEEMTTLATIVVGDAVNFEQDMLMRYSARAVALSRSANSGAGDS